MSIGLVVVIVSGMICGTIVAIFKIDSSTIRNSDKRVDEKREEKEGI